ncbi:Leucine-rich repeat-containing protein 3B [Halotydeus destructor]|nr:Leucine-rich repeat-containing protein 3B [Halotydeus destructor]
MRNAFGDSDKGDRFMADLVTMLTQGDLNKLRILRLDNNTIQSIPNPDVFCSLTNLQYLHLSQNFLVDAKINISCFDRMKLLDISDNFITNLNNESLALLENPRSLIFHVNMTRNPFRCDCDFLPVFKWLKSLKSTGTWVVGVKNFRCSTGYPDRNINRPISSLKESDLKCMEQPLEQDMTGYITASYAVLISLCMALTILVAALIYSTRQHIAKGWTYLSNSLAAKREYTCLEQENKRPPQIQTVGIEEVAV